MPRRSTWERMQQTESAKGGVPAPLPTPGSGSGSGSGSGGGNGSSRKHSPTVTTMYITKTTSFTTTIDTSVLEGALTVAAASRLGTGAKSGHIALSDYNLNYFPTPTTTPDPCDAAFFAVASTASPHTRYVD
ncbi:hypothetical protein TGAMA5MH_03543 [Trichoderma gamsii]|uniref:Uncharacterized protein n=1 Tax=Trichoderma gamsii TaxID=398673 RepID=A0A2K0TGT1_9HYPO|nr:hypothetical protein TGAMA5MH_03543 [Trichoderma gamsii]